MLLRLVREIAVHEVGVLMPCAVLWCVVRGGVRCSVTVADAAVNGFDENDFDRRNAAGRFEFTTSCHVSDSRGGTLSFC